MGGTIHGRLLTLAGGEIFVINFVDMSRDSFWVTIDGETRAARLVDDKLIWDDGDVWRRHRAQTSGKDKNKPYAKDNVRRGEQQKCSRVSGAGDRPCGYPYSFP